MKNNHLTFLRKLVSKEFQQQQEQETAPFPLPFNEAQQVQIQTWIRDEINALKQEQDNPDQQTNDLLRWKGFKISTDLSVPELSYFLKLLCDTGIIKNANKSELMDFVATFCASVNTPNISGGSIKKKFYVDNAAVAASIRDKLIMLLNQSKKKD